MTPSRRARISAFLALLPMLIFLLSGMPVEPDEGKIDPVLRLSAARDEFPPDPTVPAAPSRAGWTQLPVFIGLGSQDEDFEGRIHGLDGDAKRVSERLYVARISADSLRYISRWDSVRYIEGGKPTRPFLDKSRLDTFADNVQSGAGLPQGFFTGAGINVGIVDTGLDDTHRDFRDGLNATRVVNTYAAPSQPFGISMNPMVDEDGHGTHVAGIAAGNGFSSGGTFTGMAPEANLLIGKTNFFTTDVVSAVDNLMKASGSNPIVVNLSLGLMTGPHDGTDENHDPQGSLFTKGIDDLAKNPPGGGEGIIVVAAGNERNGEEHFQRASLEEFASVTAFLKDLLIPPGTTAIHIDCWADAEDRYDVTVTMGSDSITVGSGNRGATAGNRIFVFNRTDSPPNGATHIAVFLAPTAGTTAASIRFVRTRNGGRGQINAYLDNYYRKSTGTWHNLFQSSTEEGTITEPANAGNVIAVGSYNTKSGGGAGAIGEISSFSSLGPTRDGRRKPDLAAPGSVLYSARSSQASYSLYEIVPANDNYAILQGTSMAAPHVTGIAALVWESNPALTSEQMRERLRRTVSPPPDGSTPPNNTWGTGTVNALQAVTWSVASVTAPVSALTGTPVTMTSENSSGAFGAPLTVYTWGLMRLPSGPRTVISTSSSATFTPNIPGDYRVDLTVSQSDPAGTVAGSATKILRANHIPVAAILGPSSSDNTAPVEFQGSASDLDSGQPKTFHWILVSRPAGSTATSLAPSGVEDAILSPDVAGSYEVGLRVDDGLDSSPLVTKIYTAGTVPSDSGGGGGSCSILPARSLEPVPAPLSGPFLFLLPLAVLGIRRTAGKILRERNR